MALDGQKLKSFSLSKINHMDNLESHFAWNAAIDKQIIEDEGIWFSEATQEIVLQIRPEMSNSVEKFPVKSVE
jgi:hypothetical protein